MRIVVLVNDVAELEPTQTTSMLADGCAQRGHQTWLAGVGDLELTPQGVVAVRARPMATEPARLRDRLRRTARPPPEHRALEVGDVLC